MRIQILLVATWEIDRTGLRYLLGSTNKTEILAEATNDASLVETAIGCGPDVILICIGKHESVDAGVIRSLKFELPMTKIVIVSPEPAADEVLAYLTSGVDACWLKRIPKSLIVPALHSLCLEQSGFSLALAAFVFRLVESQFPGVASLNASSWRSLRRRNKQVSKARLNSGIQYEKASSFQ